MLNVLFVDDEPKILEGLRRMLRPLRAEWAMAFAGGGACKSVQTTPLMSVEEAVQAMKKAGESGYRPLTVTTRAA